MNPSQQEKNRFNSLRVKAGFFGFNLKKKGDIYVVWPQIDPTIQVECFNLNDVVKYLEKKTGKLFVTKWD